jgi:hypothetical protein
MEVVVFDAGPKTFPLQCIGLVIISGIHENIDFF